MIEIIVIGGWAAFMIGYKIRKKRFKKVKKENLVFYDYSKFVVKYKKIDEKLNQQTKLF